MEVNRSDVSLPSHLIPSLLAIVKCLEKSLGKKHQWLSTYHGNDFKTIFGSDSTFPALISAQNGDLDIQQQHLKYVVI